VTIVKRRLKDLASLALIVAAVAGCKQLQQISGPKIIKSSDGKFQITVPGGWRVNHALNKDASLAVQNVLEETYAIVITESKSDFASHMTLNEFTDITRNAMLSKLNHADGTPPTGLTINGNEARQYLIKGERQGINLAYLITNVETSAHYHQIITWTLSSRIDENQLTLQTVTASFREVQARK
jgi:hypothetical protein